MENQKLMDLLQDNVFMEKILSAASVEEVKSLFSEQGITLTDENVAALGQAIEKAIANGGELSEDDLAGVSGGINIDNKAAVAIGSGLFAVGLAGGAYVMHKASGWWRDFKHSIASDERKRYEEVYGKDASFDKKKV